jgi:hypothetical protein
MKTAVILLITLFLVTFTTNVYTKEIPQSLYQNKEHGWLQDGKPVPDSDNIKSENGFGAQIWIIDDDRSFFDNWNKPETPKWLSVECHDIVNGFLCQDIVDTRSFNLACN